MSKPLFLVIRDTIESCAECPCSDDCTEICRAIDREIIEVNGECQKPSWCPLKEVPEYRYSDKWEEDMRNKGWNDCIDTILREEDLPY